MRVVLVSAAIAATVTAVGAQEASSFCTSVCIEPDEALRLGALEDPVSVGGLPEVRWIGDRWWVTDPLFIPHTILHYDESGSFVGEIGEQGEGPGKFSWLRWAVPWAADSALVSEVGDRVQVVAADGGTRWLARMPTGLGVHRLGDALLVSGHLQASPGRGHPLHVYSLEGEHVRSFGEDTPGYDDSHRVGLRRIIGESSDGGFWAVRPDRYLLQRWSLTGQLLEELEVLEEWFPARATDVGGWDDVRPEPTIAGIQEDGQYLLVLLQIADPRWEPVRRGEQARGVSPAMFRRMKDGVVDVVSRGTGQVVARHRIDEPLHGFAASGMGFSIRESESGLKQVVLWSLVPS
jgi:hypothetical protein